MRSTWYTALLRITAVLPKPRQAYGYTIYYVEKRVPDYESNTTVREYTLTTVCQDWTKRVIDKMGVRNGGGGLEEVVFYVQ